MLRITPQQKGFSLIEIMVVVFLIALTVSIVSINFNQNVAKAVEGEARRFVALAELLCEESIIQGKTFGIDTENGNSYRFLTLTKEKSSNESETKLKWVAVEGDDLFRLRTLPEYISIEIEVHKAGNRISSQRIECGTDGLLPRLVVHFDADEVQYEVVNDQAGGLRIEAGKSSRGRI